LATGTLATVSIFFRTLFISSLGKPYSLNTNIFHWKEWCLKEVKDQLLKPQTEPQNHKINEIKRKKSLEKYLQVSKYLRFVLYKINYITNIKQLMLFKKIFEENRNWNESFVVESYLQRIETAVMTTWNWKLGIEIWLFLWRSGE